TAGISLLDPLFTKVSWRVLDISPSTNSAVASADSQRKAINSTTANILTGNFSVNEAERLRLVLQSSGLNSEEGDHTCFERGCDPASCTSARPSANPRRSPCAGINKVPRT